MTTQINGYQRLTASGATSVGILSRIVKLLYGFVLILALLLAAITIHGFKPVSDPITPIGLLDKISFVMGVHDKQAVTVLDLGTKTKGIRNRGKFKTFFHYSRCLDLDSLHLHLSQTPQRQQLSFSRREKRKDFAGTLRNHPQK